MSPKVLLVYAPPQLMKEELPRFDGSLGPLYLAAALERAGFETDILDASVGAPGDHLSDTFDRRVELPSGLIRVGMSDDRICEYIARGGYNVIGIHSNFTPQTKMAVGIAQAAKRVSEDILVIAGGVNARALPERFFAGGVDAICTTEGERIIVELVQAFGRGERLEVPGTMTMKDGQIRKWPLQPGYVLTDLDHLPFPSWHKLPFGQYDQVLKAGGRDSLAQVGRTASLMTSRGCPFKCLFCHISDEKDALSESGGIGALRVKSVDRVMEELTILKALGVSKIYFEDDSLLAKKSRVKQIFSRARVMGLHIADVNGVNLVHFLKRGPSGLVIDEEYLELLVSSGFDQIVFPVESASQRILDKYATGKLNHSTLNVVELVRIATRLGITCPINMMIGFPDETEAEIRSSVELGKRLVEAGAPYCSLYVPIPFPGSKLFSMALAGGHLEPDFDTDNFNWRKPTMRNTVVSPERIEELQHWGWRFANKEEYVRARLAMSIGPRWKSGEPE